MLLASLYQKCGKPSSKLRNQGHGARRVVSPLSDSHFKYIYEMLRLQAGHLLNVVELLRCRSMLGGAAFLNGSR